MIASVKHAHPADPVRKTAPEKIPRDNDSTSVGIVAPIVVKPDIKRRQTLLKKKWHMPNTDKSM